MWDAPESAIAMTPGPLGGGNWFTKRARARFVGTCTSTVSIWGDVVIARKDIGTSYHLSVVVDDALQGVTHVTRGRDLFMATHVHRLLQALMGLPTPIYHHHDLIRDDAGRKLSKSDGDKSLSALRDEGVTAAEIRSALGF
jgi:glutamyl-Q tRNA(Asp) synthetase